MMKRSRVMAVVGAAALLTTSLSAVTNSTSFAEETPDAQGAPFLVGRAISDVTGEPGENGLMGYGDSNQKSTGVHTRQFARAFVFADPATGKRVAIVNTDSLSGWHLVREKVKAQLADRFGDRYNDENLFITGTHTHATPGGLTDYSLYNVTTMGVHEQSLNAMVDGVVDAITRADADLAPADVAMGTSQVTNASAQRSAKAFENNPQWLQDRLPTERDTTSTTMTITRNGEVDSLLNWFAVHSTSLPTENKLISSDNKGYTEYLIEKGDHAVDYTDLENSPFIAGLFYPGGGDATSNLNLKPGSGPTDDPFENVKIIGQRQYDGIEAALGAQESIGTGVDYRTVWVDMQHQQVSPEFSTTGKTEATCSAILGAPFGVGSSEDGGGGVPEIFSEGLSGNKFYADATKLRYDNNAALRECQYPKAFLFESGAINGVQTKLPVSLVRLGDHYFAFLPGEITAASSIMMRDAVANAVGTTADKVVVTSVTNGYAHYFATPWEFDTQNYEGGATIFGRYTVPAFNQVLNQLGTSMKDGTSIDPGQGPALNYIVTSAYGRVLYDTVPIGSYFGKELTAPASGYSAGETASVAFQGAHPNTNIRHGGTYLEVQRLGDDGQWSTVAVDSDFSTKFIWKRQNISRSIVTIEWEIPDTATPGAYRIVYNGTERRGNGKDYEFTGTSSEFTVA